VAETEHQEREQEHQHQQQQHRANKRFHGDLAHARDMSVEQLKKLADENIREADQVVRKSINFQREMIKRDPAKFKALGIDSHNLLHEPVTHHRHHEQPQPSAMLETSSSISASRPQAEHMVIPDILLEQAARRAKEDAEDGLDELVAKANGAIMSNRKLVTDLVGAKDKAKSLRREYDELAQSDADDMATLKREEALLTQANPPPDLKSAASLTNEELSLLEERATTLENKGARRVRAKLQNEKHRRRRKYGH